MAVKIGTEKIGDEHIDIEVRSSGMFMAIVDEEEYEAKTLDELKTKLATALRKRAESNPIDVTVVDLTPRKKTNSYVREEPFQDGRGIIQAKLRKKHARRGVFLLTSMDGVKFELYSGHGRDRQKICRRLNEDEIATYERLAHEVDAAEAALENWLISVRIDPLEALEGKKVSK